jgi:hypothetical protein
VKKKEENKRTMAKNRNRKPSESQPYRRKAHRQAKNSDSSGYQTGDSWN